MPNTSLTKAASPANLKRADYARKLRQLSQRVADLLERYNLDSSIWESAGSSAMYSAKWALTSAAESFARPAEE